MYLLILVSKAAIKSYIIKNKKGISPLKAMEARKRNRSRDSQSRSAQGNKICLTNVHFMHFMLTVRKGLLILIFRASVLFWDSSRVTFHIV